MTQTKNVFDKTTRKASSSLAELVTAAHAQKAIRAEKIQEYFSTRVFLPTAILI